eukprot:CAMPEP_0194201656 /NCGR_PEP_ID=MMETSP0156-20130528/1870_1 /TAXON_ID=33649 /ORGANISM="Thalassionema nitzschioides, Strain L26-B" /LENGTH=509 /DNA_ID=CAMNT_0038926909 /DNA_START=83 /DNA_END=1609 /DNA_ORIENTATION=-
MKILVLEFLLLLGAVKASNTKGRYLRAELSDEARQALSQAVLSAITSPTGEIDPTAMESAISKGVSREYILKAAEVSIQKMDNTAMVDPRSVTLKDPSYKPAQEQGLESTFPEQMSSSDATEVSAGIHVEKDNNGSDEDREHLPQSQVNEVKATSSSSEIQKAAGMPVTLEEGQSVEPQQPKTTVQASNTQASASGNKKRKFVEYQSSEWEMLWLSKVYDWSNKRQICTVLIEEQKDYVHLYLRMLCTSKLEGPHSKWCIIDDGELQLWYNTENLQSYEFSWERPPSIPADVAILPPQAVIPSAEFEKVASKMIFLDEQTGETYVEYIEPLVSHLRFPLSRCIRNPNPEHRQFDVKFKGFLIPPPPVVHSDRALLYDTGSTSWTDGLKYIIEVWKRHGVAFDAVTTYDEETSPDAFWPSIPQEYISFIKKMKGGLASLPEEHSPTFPFLPSLMKEEASENDYVVLKVDIDRALVESRIIDFIINDPNTNVDEIMWENHITGNYLMYQEW